MANYRVEYKGIVANMCTSSKGTNKFVILCYGLPSYPPNSSLDLIRQLNNNGINVIVPEYYGTFSSEGVCTINNCVDTILETISFLKAGQGKDEFTQKNIQWSCQNIILLGVSFGGSVALVVGAKSSAIKKIVAISSPTNYRDHNLKYTEENLNDLTICLRNAYKNTWRITPQGWTELLDGSCDLNPIDYLKQLKDKKILFIHALNDSVVSYNRSKELYHQLKSDSTDNQLVLIQGDLHLSFSDINPQLSQKILKWIKQT